MLTTTIAPLRAETDRPARHWWTVPIACGVGFLGGAVLGILARLWMRLISDDPEFSWAGTLVIIIAFALFGAGQALSWSARRTALRRPGITVARVVAAVLALSIFGGAGSIMLPTVLGGGLAVWRSDWRRVVRALAALAAVPVAAFVVREIVAEFGWGAHSLAGIAGFVAIYGVVIAVLGPTVAPLADGWRMPRHVRVVLIIAVLAPLVLAALALRGA
jgi:hypothetical protein